MPMPTTLKSPDLFSNEELASLDTLKIPRHIAIIPDGNRRWAKARGLSPVEGHWNGAENLIKIVKAAKEIGIKTVTIYTFSTENWSRSKEEVDGVMTVIAAYLKQQCPRMVDEGIRVDSIGDPSSLPSYLIEVLNDTKLATSQCDQISLLLALNYGGRNEITRAVKEIANLVKNGLLSPDDINESVIANQLDTGPWGDPDLLLRPGGEWRISNFLLWQISYSEIQVTDELWPDFSPHHLLNAIKNYGNADRRKGR
jgi:undecaprenyl diphosphate synthase